MYFHARFLFSCAAFFALAAGIPTEVVASTTTSTTTGKFIVDDDKVQCPTAQYTEIEDAVAAAPAGATIQVCPGVYKKQVVITKALTINAQSGSILQPSSPAVNASNIVTNAPILALLLVQNTTGVNVTDLTVDGSLATQSSCTAFLVGILYQNASGVLSHMAVRNIRQGSGLGACESGLGIYVQSGNGGSSAVTVSNSSVHDYQKGGIAGDESGTTLTLTGNAVTGDGSASQLAQNGLQIAYGATGSITQNRVANHVYSACSSQSICPAAAVNVVVYNSSGVTVQGNITTAAQVGVSVTGDSNTVSKNDVDDNVIFDGIDLIGNSETASGNSIFHSDGNGIYVSGSGETLNNNVINEASVGIFEGSGTTATLSGNSFYNVPVPTEQATTGTAAASPALRQAEGVRQVNARPTLSLVR